MIFDPFNEAPIILMREKILLLEDDEALRGEVADSLEDVDQSLQIVQAANAIEAIEAARSTQFDLMITDVRMAGAKDGLGALAEVKKFCPAMHSIVMTGHMYEDRPEVRAMRCGTDFFLKKPFGLAKLSRAVQQVLETRQTQASLANQLKGFLNSAKRKLLRVTTGVSEVEEAEVHQERRLLFSAYFTAVQTTTLSVLGANIIWDHLVDLERRYEDLLIDVGPEAEELAALYRGLLDLSANLTEKAPTGKLPPREAHQIGMNYFQQFYDRVTEGTVSRVYLSVAPAVWNLQADIRAGKKDKPDDPQWPRMISEIFGVDPAKVAEREKAQKEKQEREQQKELIANLENLAVTKVEKPEKEISWVQKRDGFLETFYTCIRSRRLGLAAAIRGWDALIFLEKERGALPGQQSEQAKALGEKFARLSLSLETFLSHPQALESQIEPRGGGFIAVEDFRRLYDGLQNGRLGLTDLKRAPATWYLAQLIVRGHRAKPPDLAWSKPYQVLFGRAPL
jgi:DNA-binding NarL/FixJ family response regulator